MASEYNDFVAQVLQADSGINHQSLGATNTKVGVEEDKCLLVVPLGHPANSSAYHSLCGIVVGCWQEMAVWVLVHGADGYVVPKLRDVSQTNAPPFPANVLAAPLDANTLPGMGSIQGSICLVKWRPS